MMYTHKHYIYHRQSHQHSEHLAASPSHTHTARGPQHLTSYYWTLHYAHTVRTKASTAPSNLGSLTKECVSWWLCLGALWYNLEHSTMQQIAPSNSSKQHWVTVRVTRCSAQPAALELLTALPSPHLFCPLKSGAAESRGSQARPPENTGDTEHTHVRQIRADIKHKLERKKRPYHQHSPRPKQVHVLKRSKGRPRQQPVWLHTPWERAFPPAARRPRVPPPSPSPGQRVPSGGRSSRDGETARRPRAPRRPPGPARPRNLRWCRGRRSPPQPPRPAPRREEAAQAPASPPRWGAGGERRAAGDGPLPPPRRRRRLPSSAGVAAAAPGPGEGMGSAGWSSPLRARHPLPRRRGSRAAPRIPLPECGTAGGARAAAAEAAGRGETPRRGERTLGSGDGSGNPPSRSGAAGGLRDGARDADRARAPRAGSARASSWQQGARGACAGQRARREQPTALARARPRAPYSEELRRRSAPAGGRQPMRARGGLPMLLERSRHAAPSARGACASRGHPSPSRPLRVPPPQRPGASQRPAPLPPRRILAPPGGAAARSAPVG